MAVKQVFLYGQSQIEDKVNALKQEIELYKQLQHKNIVKYLGASHTKESLDIFLEYVPGGSISFLLQKFGGLKENLVRIYVKQILEGLEYLHWNKVVHRGIDSFYIQLKCIDIKGANILVNESGICKLADFGSSKQLSGMMSEIYTSLRGTANWMAPEVIRQTGHGRYADIWSIGCTMIEMITGKPPYAEYQNPITAMFYIGKNQSPPSFPKDLSKECEDFLMWCFKKTPTERKNVYQLRQHRFITGEAPVIQEIKIENKKKFSMDEMNFEDEGLDNRQELPLSINEKKLAKLENQLKSKEK